MDAGTHSLKVIFGQDRRHLVPLYQRPYVWSQQLQWDPLWEDVRGIADRALANQPMRPHFMGAIVLDQADVPYGTIDTRWVIDGQQRLTTLQILLEAFGDACGSHGLEAHEKAAKRLTRNDDPLSKEEDHVFKIWPTNTDQEHFKRVMQAGTPKQVLGAYKMPTATWVGHPIADAYLFFFRKVDGWLQEGTGRKERADAFIGALRDAIRLVVIDLKEGDDPQLIFETLNARGTPLLPSDLIKNYLFIKAGSDREALYKKYWQHFDSDAEYWRQSIGRGHNQRARLDIFIQHYLTLKTRDEVPVGHLYGVFKSFAQKQASATAEDHFKDLWQYSEIYRSFDNFPKTSKEGRFFRRLAAMDISTAFPFLLEVFARSGQHPQDLGKCLEYLESFLVRRLICQMNTRGYNRLFTEFLRVFDEPSDTLPARLEKELAAGKAASNLWPSDAEVLQALLETPIYKTLVRARVSMVLEALNDAMHDGKAEQVLLENLTIEHLMPQAWTTHWPPPQGPDAETAIAERNLLIHSLGNLTLLTKKLNPSISNGKWSDKHQNILMHSALNLNRQLPTEWSDESIRQRTQLLASLANKVWTAPAAVKSAGLRTVAPKSPETENDQDPLVELEDTAKPPSNRQQILHRFWTSLLERARGKAPLLDNRSPTTDSWLSAPSGRGGFWFSISITQEFARIEVYIRIKNGQDFHNKAIFHQLHDQKAEIEEAFGGPLEWQELPGRIGCRICTMIPGSWQLPEKDWAPLQDRMIDLLVRLEVAVRGPIHEVDTEAVLGNTEFA